MSTKNFSKERIGLTNKNTYGSLMEIVEYNTYRDILVKFIETGNIINTRMSHFLNGNVKNPYDKTMYGIGYVGEGEYKTRINGKRTPKYNAWRGMIERCYSGKRQEKQPTYKGIIVDPFQNFAKWYDENYYEIEGQIMHLDKDILIKGNKIYSLDTCVFVPNSINTLFTKNNKRRGDFPLGVTFHKLIGKYEACCSNGKGKNVYLDYHDTPEDAFQAYKTFKESLIKQIAERHKNKIPEKLYNALITYQVEITD